jgi:phosphate/sulfate permease
LIAKEFESKESISKSEKDKVKKGWLIAQWLSTGLLWSQWLVQDFANIYVFLLRRLSLVELLISLLIILVLMAFLFKTRGGKIQEIVNSKANTQHIRSATFIDLTYAMVLYLFTQLSNVPMSTTWVFIGILAGREIAISYQLNKNEIKASKKKIIKDLYKVNIGLIISILLAYGIGMLNAFRI